MHSEGAEPSAAIAFRPTLLDPPGTAQEVRMRIRPPHRWMLDEVCGLSLIQSWELSNTGAFISLTEAYR